MSAVQWRMTQKRIIDTIILEIIYRYIILYLIVHSQ